MMTIHTNKIQTKKSDKEEEDEDDDDGDDDNSRGTELDSTEEAQDQDAMDENNIATVLNEPAPLINTRQTTNDAGAQNTLSDS
eukprot:4729686-Ditylum_brightwellii.AAC.1